MIGNCVKYSEDYASTVKENIPIRNIALKLKTRHEKSKVQEYLQDYKSILFLRTKQKNIRIQRNSVPKNVKITYMTSNQKTGL